MPKVPKLEKEDQGAPESLTSSRPDHIRIPPPVIEALLVGEVTGNRIAVKDVCNQIREIAEQQGFTQF